MKISTIPNKTNILIIDDLFASTKDSSIIQNLFADESYLKKIYYKYIKIYYYFLLFMLRKKRCYIISDDNKRFTIMLKISH